MKHFLVVILFLVSGHSVAGESKPAQDQQINILFIGNSFTAWNNLPQLVKQVFEEGQPGLSIHTQQVIGGGQSMFTHWNYFKSQTFLEMSTVTDDAVRERLAEIRELQALSEPPTEYVGYIESLGRKGKMPPNFDNILGWSAKRLERMLQNNPRTQWDYVVLQSWLDESEYPDKGYAEWAPKFAELAEQHGTKVILYITAPFVQNNVPVDGPKLQGLVDLQMEVAHRVADQVKPVAVVPVPLAINMIQQGGTDLTFCFENNFHPNQTTTYLTANMFYAALFEESPEGFAFDAVTCTKVDDNGKDPDGGDATVVFDAQTKTYLQKMAFEAVQAFNQVAKTATSDEPE